MAQASTHHPLRLVYNELPALDRLEAEYFVSHDAAARAEYVRLLETQRALPKVTFSPPQITVDAILAYSRRGVLEVG